MRLQFFDLSRPKQAAKNLARIAGAPSLSSVQASLAQCLGYRDWYDLSMAPGPDTAVDPGDPEVIRIISARKATETESQHYRGE